MLSVLGERLLRNISKDYQGDLYSSNCFCALGRSQNRDLIQLQSDYLQKLHGVLYVRMYSIFSVQRRALVQNKHRSFKDKVENPA